MLELSKYLEKIKRYRLFWVITILGLVLDQLTKFWIMVILPAGTYHPYESIEVIGDVFYIVHVHNPGASWGILAGFSLGFALLAVVALGLIFYFRKTLELRKPFLQITFGLLCGGIVGNLIDRVAYGYVIDFIDIHLPGYRWPAFNVADSCICVGVGLYFIWVFFMQRQRKAK